jgi:predicted nuclease of predicted toxin-antitoxin system
MLLSISKNTNPKFLLDENVRRELLIFLKQQGFDVEFKPKDLSNGELAEFSKSEQRVLVTNDSDFSDTQRFSKDKIHSIVWLRIPSKSPLLIKSLSKLINEIKSDEFKARLIILYEDKIEISEFA